VHIILIAIYCLMAALILFGLTFHNEMLGEQERKKKSTQPLIVIDGGKAKSRRRA
jgi:hypothetical protein